MTATNTPPSPDPTRSGAVWVTGMGAFLLLAAAAVFTAVRWEQIPDAAKLATLVAATGACLVAGRGLRQSLPASAGALFHLGAFLVPVDVAAIGVRAGFDWSTMLLAQGLVATATFGVAALSERSVVLRWAFGVSTVLLAGGIGASSQVPAPLALAMVAVLALGLRRHDAAVGWAAIAGSAPLLAFFDRIDATGGGVLERLGMLGSQPRATAVVTGLLAGGVLVAAGRRRDDVGLALLGAAAAATGVAATWTGVDPAPGVSLIALAVAFLVVESVAFALRRDDFWRAPARIVACVAELAAHLCTPALALVVLLVPGDFAFEADAHASLAAAVLGLGWVTAELRTGGRLGSTVGAATAAVGAVALATAAPVAVSLALVTVGGMALLLPRLPGAGVAARPGAHALLAVAAIAAPQMALDSSTLVVVLTGVAGSVLLTEAAVRRSLVPGPADPVGSRLAEPGVWVLALLAIAPGAIAVAGVLAETGRPVAALAGGAALALALAAQADRGRTPTTSLPLGTVARLQAVTLLAATTELPALEMSLVACAVAVLWAADAARLWRPEVALGTSVALPLAVGGLCAATGLGLPATGVALTVAAAVIAGLGSQLDRDWRLPVVAAVGLCLGAGLELAHGDPTSFADAIIVTGGIGLAASIAMGRLDGVFATGAVITGGIWLRLAEGEVGASEPYLLPVSLLLLIAGARARSIGTSSWVAYGPVVGLLGGSALVERLAGGTAWHAVGAGAVGVVAVIAGGARRLAAPLLLGSGLLVALVAFETLAITSTFPTWIWLGLGGAVLLGAGVAMERHDVGPIETGRRLVDVVGERYA